MRAPLPESAKGDLAANARHLQALFSEVERLVGTLQTIAGRVYLTAARLHLVAVPEQFINADGTTMIDHRNLVSRDQVRLGSSSMRKTGLRRDLHAAGKDAP